MDSIKEFFTRLWRQKPAPQEIYDSRQMLKDAVENAVLIVMTASENAIPLEQEIVKTIIGTKNALSENAVDVIQESEFWLAYEQAADRIKPITINSIKATHDPQPTGGIFFLQIFSRKPIPFSRRCAANYKSISLITLLLLIIIQIYWYVGWSLTTDINKQTRTIAALNDNLAILIHQDQGNTLNNRLPVQRESPTPSLQIRQRIQEHKEWRDAAVLHLKNWNQVWSNLDLLTLQPWQDADFSSLPLEVQKRIQFVAAGNTLEAITGYILPILYGLIGACFYILRQLPREIESLTFSINSYIDYSLRMAQGPLAGILTSYFFSSKNESTGQPFVNPSQIHSLDTNLNSLSPLAVAFLAGYSVEYVFRFIDKMLNSPTETTGLPIRRPEVPRPLKPNFVSQNKTTTKTTAASDDNTSP